MLVVISRVFAVGPLDHDEYDCCVVPLSPAIVEDIRSKMAVAVGMRANVDGFTYFAVYDGITFYVSDRVVARFIGASKLEETYDGPIAVELSRQEFEALRDDSARTECDEVHVAPDNLVFEARMKYTDVLLTAGPIYDSFITEVTKKWTDEDEP